MADERRVPLWDLRDVSKAFPGVQALDRVSIELRRGEVHALVGENGSGKSTLVKCIAGVHLPDGGELLREGERVHVVSPSVGQALGVATFHQEFSLVRTLSVAENICLGRLPQRGLLVDWQAARERARRALSELDVSLDPDARVESLSVAQQQFVEIAKAISHDMSLLILDEPTAALGPSDVERLHEVIRRIADRGRAILYISHRLDEVMDVADRITVLKDGRVAGHRQNEDTSVDEVVRLMVGTDLEAYFPDRVPHGGTPRVVVEDLRTEDGVAGVSFTVHAGEVLGLGGISGAGRTEIARALFGVDRVTEGRIVIDGEEVSLRAPADAIDAGIALIPENRKAHGLFFNFAGPQNTTSASLDRVAAGPVLRLAREREAMRELVRKLDIEGNVMGGSVKFLSGGNQQKVVIARWLFSQASFLILDEPTQGVDIGAKVEVYNLMNELTEQGIAMLLISSDFPELIEMSDRIAVVRKGRIVHEAPSEEFDEEELTRLAAGGAVAA
jgi:ribose transport system ATP-binding protein